MQTVVLIGMTLKTLFEQGTISLALLPDANDYLLNEQGKELRQDMLAKNDTEYYHNLPTIKKLEYLDLSRLDLLDAYSVPLIAHDYGAKTPLMWNSLYIEKNMKIRNIMVIGKPKDTELILDGLKSDNKYLGGGAGVGFKESAIPHLITQPSDLQSVNIIVNHSGQLTGHNTDALGFIMSLEDKLQVVGKQITNENFTLYGAGGVAKEVARLLCSKKASSIAIVNRTVQKAVDLAYNLNKEFPNTVSYGVGEELSRGVALNSITHPSALINTTDKGADRFKKYAFYAPVDDYNENLSRTLLRYLRELLPDLIIADIVIPKGQESISLRLAKAEGFEDKNLLNGIPMVINQAAPAYKLVQEANLDKHSLHLTETEALEIFKRRV